MFQVHTFHHKADLFMIYFMYAYLIEAGSYRIASVTIQKFKTIVILVTCLCLIVSDTFLFN